jgi:hypothetical protein
MATFCAEFPNLFISLFIFFFSSFSSFFQYYVIYNAARWIPNVSANVKNEGGILSLPSL